MKSLEEVKMMTMIKRIIAACVALVAGVDAIFNMQKMSDTRSVKATIETFLATALYCCGMLVTLE
jgi:hypothetical protein